MLIVSQGAYRAIGPHESATANFTRAQVPGVLMIKARYDWDLVIFGSGFAGCLMAMIARKRGYRTLILERHQHPRITLGESNVYSTRGGACGDAIGGGLN